MAVAEAARKSDFDTGRAIAGFYFHRLLCRIFSRRESPFVLKGGQGMLARTTDARATRDIDLLSETGDLEQALSELRELAALDLGDFIVYEFLGSEPIKADDEYRQGLKVRFVPLLGRKRMQSVSVDLVVDQIPCGEPDVFPPADRIEIAGIPVFDYRMYPVACSIADKLCAMVETHDGRPSSRVKDLVDILVYASTEDVDGRELVERIELEARARRLALPHVLSIPDEWRRVHRGTYRKLVGQTGLHDRRADLEQGEILAGALFDPVLDRSALGSRWDHVALQWKPKKQE